MNKGGYTLMEVSLFLAISGMLTLVAIVGIGPRLTNVRFSTGMRAIQENITKQLSASKLGDNSSTRKLNCSLVGPVLKVTLATGDDDSSCVYIGKIAVLNSADNTVVYRPVVGLREAASSCPTTMDDSSLHFVKECSLATIPSDGVAPPETYVLPSGITQDSGTTRAVGYVRSPNTNTLHRFSFTKSSYSDISLNDSTISYDTYNGVSNSKVVPVCFKLSNRVAKLQFSVDSDEIKLTFNEAC